MLRNVSKPGHATKLDRWVEDLAAYLSSRNRSLYDKRYVGVRKGVPFSYSDTRYVYRGCMHISWQSRLAGRNGRTEISIEVCPRPAKPCVSQTQAPPIHP